MSPTLRRRSPPSTHLVFIRTPSSSPDAYELAASNRLHFVPHHLPILRTTYLNIPELSELLRSPNEDLKGMIITSSRSVQALAQAQAPPHFTTSNESWFLTQPIFVVGQGTRDSVLSLLPHPPPSLNVLGGDDGLTGNGDKLARFILDHFNVHSPTSTRPRGEKIRLLYLTGDKNRDTIPSILENPSTGIELSRVQVYETIGIEGDQLRRAVDQLHLDEAATKEERTKRIWLIFFSPSGAKAALKEFRRRGWVGSEREGESSGAARGIRIAAIGPTTRRYLEEEEGLKVDAEARTPDAKELIRCIEEVERRELEVGDEEEEEVGR